VTASHGALDALTNGGLGVAFFAPFDATRYFFPWRPVEVSPIGVAAFFSQRGLEVFVSELLWLWLPAAALVGGAWACRAWARHSRGAEQVGDEQRGEQAEQP
jgi:inner membrane protein